MKKEEQTTQVKEHLYNLTLMFVRKYQPRYYMQYTGELEDLAMEFYCQFLTPKSRIEGKEESLLDKYNPEITTLPYLVKIAVQRMLIDRSRADQVRVRSIDRLTEEFGDYILKDFGLTEDQESVDEVVFSKDFVEVVRDKFVRLPEHLQDTLIEKYAEIRGVIAPQFRLLFDRVIPEPEVEEPVEELWLDAIINNSMAKFRCQQVTPKTVCLIVGNEVLNFDRVTGVGRGKNYRNDKLAEDALVRILSIDVYKSGIDKKEVVNGEKR